MLTEVQQYMEKRAQVFESFVDANKSRPLPSGTSSDDADNSDHMQTATITRTNVLSFITSISHPHPYPSPRTLTGASP